MNSATAVSPANIAFIKFWGKTDSNQNIPYNDSMSMNLSGCLTTTTVEFDPRLDDDRIVINKFEASGSGKQRVVRILDIVRREAGMGLKAKVESANNFPTASGIASSAAAFSALAMAASTAAGLTLSKRELSRLARLGSGSACRSIFDGFVYWKGGKDDRTSYAYQLAPVTHWDLWDIVAVVAKESKKASSTQGHSVATSSPYFRQRQRGLPLRIKQMKEAMLKKDFPKFGRLLEEEAVDLHVMAMTSRPPIFYWNSGTMEVMKKIREWREEGKEAYFTMDAGANVHVICRAKDEAEINQRLGRIAGIESTIVNKPGRGTWLI